MIRSIFIISAIGLAANAAFGQDVDLKRQNFEQDKVERCAELDISDQSCDFLFTACGWNLNQDLSNHKFVAPLTKQVCDHSKGN